MLKYVKEIQENGLCSQVGTGTNTDFYKSIGMVERDVEQSEIDGQWYLSEKCPHVSPADLLEKSKELKTGELKGIRNQKELAPLDGFDVDEKSITRLQIAQSILSGSEQTLDWTMADNSVKSINTDDIAQVFADLAERSNNLHAKYRELKELINAAETVEAVEAIKWESENAICD